MKKNKQIALKFIAVFIITLIISLTIDTAISLAPKDSAKIKESIPLASAAAQQGCCIEDPTGKICIDDSTPAQCLPGKFVTYTGGLRSCSTAAAQDCGPQTCIPQDQSQSCLRAKTKAECIQDMNGTPVASDMDTIDQCKSGCCIIDNGLVADIMQNRTCINKTLSLAGNYDLSGMQFFDNITSQTECKKLGASTDLVCCVLGGGNCKYGFRSDCTTLNGRAIPLQGGEYCRDVRECAATSHAKIGCGKILGTEFDMYWFDSQGNQEELNQTCDYPMSYCKISQTNQTPICAQTSCDFTGLNLKQQNIKENTSKTFYYFINSDAPIRSNLLLTGTSECYNFYGDFGDPTMYEKSTGLQNQILHCSLGKVEIQGLGPDRNLLCKDGYGTGQIVNQALPTKSETLHGVEVNNSWQSCTSCGKGGLVDPVGDFFGPFPPFGKLLNSLAGKYCTKGECDTLGANEFCVYKEKLPAMSFLTSPVSSCVPKYPPGTNSLSTGNVSYCGKCGPTNGLWNICRQDECESLGDCDFKPLNGLWTPLIGLATFIAGRIVWMPVDCTLYATWNDISGGTATNWGQEWENCWRIRKQNLVFKIIGFPFSIIGLINDKENKVTNLVGTITGLGGLLVTLGLLKK